MLPLNIKYLLLSFSYGFLTLCKPNFIMQPNAFEQQFVRPSFDLAMEPVGRYLKDNMHYIPFWKLVKSLYTKSIIENFQCYAQPLIPKVIHQIWLGSPFPQKYIAWRDSWLKLHPDWSYILWTDKEIEKLNLVNKKMYDMSSNYGEKSDIARVEILYRFGGLYIDTDFECVKPFDVLHHCCEFYAGLDEGPTAAFNGLIGSKKGHPLLKAYIENMKRQEHEKDSTDEIVVRTGPRYFTKILEQYLAHNTANVVLFPTTFFYPWPWFERFNNRPEQIERWVRPESMAIHHWEVSWNNGRSRLIK